MCVFCMCPSAKYLAMKYFPCHSRYVVLCTLHNPRISFPHFRADNDDAKAKAKAEDLSLEGALELWSSCSWFDRHHADPFLESIHSVSALYLFSHSP